MVGQQQSEAAPNAASGRAPVKTAFVLGWQMARLYTGPLSSNSDPSLDEDLPGLSELPAAELVKLRLAQVDVALAPLRAYIREDAALPDTSDVRSSLAEEPYVRDAVRRAILDLHITLLTDLTAVDYRLGKAYGLGRALADTCSSPRAGEAKRRRALEHHLEPHRALVIVGWLDDLKTVLPAHSGQAVADSLGRWVRWAEGEDMSGFDRKAVSDTTRVLHRCGQRWRAILSGEKDARDLLELGDYASAARGAVAQAGAVARSLVAQMWAPLLLALILLGVGIWLMIANKSTAQVIAGLGTVAGGLGVTWRSAASTLGRFSLDLAGPLWAAQIDLAVGNRLTPTPQRDYVAELERPRGRWARAWRELWTSDPQAPRGVPPKEREEPVEAGTSRPQDENDTAVMPRGQDRDGDPDGGEARK